jgi:hypothetical protein
MVDNAFVEQPSRLRAMFEKCGAKMNIENMKSRGA